MAPRHTRVASQNPAVCLEWEWKRCNNPRCYAATLIYLRHTLLSDLASRERRVSGQLDHYALHYAYCSSVHCAQLSNTRCPFASSKGGRLVESFWGPQLSGAAAFWGRKAHPQGPLPPFSSQRPVPMSNVKGLRRALSPKRSLRLEAQGSEGSTLGRLSFTGSRKRTRKQSKLQTAGAVDVDPDKFLDEWKITPQEEVRSANAATSMQAIAQSGITTLHGAGETSCGVTCVLER